MDHSRLSLEVHAAYKRYGDLPVLNGLNMAVPAGSIYGLLGASGCGKSTLLSCIVGQMDLDSGSIRLDCARRTDIGYMPQAISLYMLLTIEEMLSYYGRVGGLSVGLIREKTAKVACLLDLPPVDRVIESLSGGQQRRVSLAVALLTSPKILLLDEPTVGLDPVLSQSIWKHLMKLAKEEQKTIVITTHYIEEARQAHMVGLMRGGVLLCQDCPEELIRQEECETMEQVFLKLSYLQEKSVTAPNNNNTHQISHKESAYLQNVPEDNRVFLRNRPFFKWACLKAECTKNCIFIWRNKPMLMLLFVLPLIICVIFNHSIGAEPKGMKVGVVNEEVFMKGCASSTQSGCHFDQPFSCRVLSRLKARGVELYEFNSVKESKDAIGHLHLGGILWFRSNYTQSLLERLEFNLNTDDLSAEYSQITAWLDMSSYYMGHFMRYHIYISFLSSIEQFLKDCEWPIETLNIPIKMEEPVYGAKIPDLTHYCSPAVVVLVIFYLPMSYTIGVLVQEKLNGVLERSETAGLELFETLMGHMLVQLMVMVVQVFIIIFVVYVWYAHPFIGSYFWTVALILLQGICGVSFGFLVALGCEHQIAATMTGVFVMAAYFFNSGSIWPQEGLWVGLRYTRALIPTAYSIESLRGITARAWPVSHPVVYKGFISVISWIFLFVFFAHQVRRFRNYVSAK